MGDAEAGGRQDPSTPPASSSIEGKLLDCCRDRLAANVLVVGHHGSMTSSRTAFLDAGGPSIFVVSSMKYGSVVLPDQLVIDELASRGQLFRTDFDDASCAQNPAKIGPDGDGEAGGCDNVRVTVAADGQVTADYWRGSD